MHHSMYALYFVNMTGVPPKYILSYLILECHLKYVSDMYHISVLKINYLMMYVVLKVGGWIRANNPVIETNK